MKLLDHSQLHTSLSISVRTGAFIIEYLVAGTPHLPSLLYFSVVALATL